MHLQVRISNAFLSHHQMRGCMESAQEHEPTAYETLCNKLRALAKSEGRIMSEAKIHKSARNLMGYVEFMLRQKIYNLINLYVDEYSNRNAITRCYFFFLTNIGLNWKQISSRFGIRKYGCAPRGFTNRRLHPHRSPAATFVVIKEFYLLGLIFRKGNKKPCGFALIHPNFF